jgi:hypothetical protein
MKRHADQWAITGRIVDRISLGHFQRDTANLKTREKKPSLVIFHRPISFPEVSRLLVAIVRRELMMDGFKV